MNKKYLQHSKRTYSIHVLFFFISLLPYYELYHKEEGREKISDTSVHRNPNFSRYVTRSKKKKKKRKEKKN